MNCNMQKSIGAGICRAYRAWPFAGVLATKMPLLTELGDDANEIRLFYENDMRFLRQF